MISDREVTFFLALGELLADIEQPKRLIEKKLDAFRKARGLTEEYVRRGIREDLVGVILKKKLALILIAKTADEVERAANPHRPQYDFGTWREDPFALPEEELAIWGIVSPYNMLRPEAQDRYMDLFSLICSGKGNEDWNCSAPHGAGRLMSRKAAFNALSMEEFQKEMEGIYTTCVVPDTLDESPMAYKSMEEIVAQIGPTAEIIERIRPVYNFKAAD